jgi:hypothetical protein
MITGAGVVLIVALLASRYARRRFSPVDQD